jgi:toxin-antitoxin system PIN domain toxin
MAASGIKVADANVWLAIAFSDHVHHRSARDRFEAQTDGTCAFCRLTQMALLRHLTNAKIMGKYVQSQQQAWQTYDRLSGDPRVLLLEEPAGIEIEFRGLSQSSSPSHLRWTDAYMAAMAKLSAAQFVTFDQGFSRFAGVDLLVLV